MNILIVNVNWVGDVLFSTPAIRAVRKKFPDSRIACLVPPRCEALVRNNPFIDEVIVAKDDTSLYSIFDSLKLIGRLRRRRFDRAIFFHRSRTKALAARLAGIGQRIGYRNDRSAIAKALSPFLLTQPFEKPSGPLHRTDYFLNLIEKAGIPAAGRTPDFFPSARARKELESLWLASGLNPQTPYAVVHAGGNWLLKRWPKDYFTQWLRLFLAETDWNAVLCGTEQENVLCRQIAEEFPSRAVSFSGKSSIDALALLLKEARFLLSNDSGPIHLAASQKTPILGLFGPTHPDLTGPISDGPVRILRKDVGCELPCYFAACNYRVCMEWLSPAQVFAETKQFINRTSERFIAP